VVVAIIIVKHEEKETKKEQSITCPFANQVHQSWFNMVSKLFYKSNLFFISSFVEKQGQSLDHSHQ